MTPGASAGVAEEVAREQDPAWARRAWLVGRRLQTGLQTTAGRSRGAMADEEMSLARSNGGRRGVRRCVCGRCVEKEAREERA